MCHSCIDRFAATFAKFTLPLDPATTLLQPDQELVVEYKRISGQWTIFVQNILRSLSSHEQRAIDRPLKKNKRPLDPRIKAMIVSSLKAQEPPGLIAKKAGVRPQTVYDQKYRIAKSTMSHSTAGRSGASAPG